VQWLAGGGAWHVRLDPAGRVRAWADEPSAEVLSHGERDAGRHEVRLAHSGHGRIHCVHSRAVRRTGTPAA